MAFARILAAVDGTDASLRGVEVAAQMAAGNGSEFILLTAVSVPQHMALASTMDQRTIEGYVERMAREAVGPATEVLQRLKVGAEVKVLVGPAAEVILSEMESLGADLVVMGRNSRYEPKERILGSVSYRVARQAHMPVLLVP